MPFVAEKMTGMKMDSSISGLALICPLKTAKQPVKNAERENLVGSIRIYMEKGKDKLIKRLLLLLLFIPILMGQQKNCEKEIAIYKVPGYLQYENGQHPARGRLELQYYIVKTLNGEIIDTIERPFKVQTVEPGTCLIGMEAGEHTFVRNRWIFPRNNLKNLDIKSAWSTNGSDVPLIDIPQCPDSGFYTGPDMEGNPRPFSGSFFDQRQSGGPACAHMDPGALEYIPDPIPAPARIVPAQNPQQECRFLVDVNETNTQ